MADATWQFADAWLLAASSGSWRRGADLSHVIGLADAYNHDIPSSDTVSRSIGRLRASGLVDVDEQRRIRRTPRGRSLVRRARGPMFEQVPRVLALLADVPLIEGEWALGEGEWQRAYDDYWNRVTQVALCVVALSRAYVANVFETTEDQRWSLAEATVRKFDGFSSGAYSTFDGIEVVTVEGEPGVMMTWSQGYLDAPSGRFGLLMSVADLIGCVDYAEWLGKPLTPSADDWVAALMLAVREPHGSGPRPGPRQWMTVRVS